MVPNMAYSEKVKNIMQRVKHSVNRMTGLITMKNNLMQWSYLIA